MKKNPVVIMMIMSQVTPTEEDHLYREGMLEFNGRDTILIIITIQGIALGLKLYVKLA